jgi:hypothetical protein
MVAGGESENHLNNPGPTGAVFNIEFLQGNVSNIHTEIKTGHVNNLQTNLPPTPHDNFRRKSIMRKRGGNILLEKTKQ